MREGKADQALKQINKAISLQPNEALFYNTKGQILLTEKQDKEALEAFKLATRKNPEYFMGHLGQGLIQKKLGDLDTAQQHLEQSIKLLPTQIGVFHLGELELRSGDQNAAVEYFRYAAQGGGEIGQAAQQYLAKLAPPPAQQAR